MRRCLLTIVLLWIGVLFVVGAVEPGSQLGFRFADVYTDFAPLYAFYRSYADHLFRGSEVYVPAGFSSACDEFARGLALLHLDLLLTQTASNTVETLTYLARLRTDVAVFCASYQPMLETIASFEEPDLEYLEEASDARLFASISELNEHLERVFPTALDALVGEERWYFAMSFAVRSLLNREAVDRIDANIVEIFYGTDEATVPLFPVPESVAGAMGELAALSGRSLAASEAEDAIRLAESIHHYLMTPFDDSDTQ